MSNAGKGWLAFGIIAVCGVVIASCAIANTSASPRPFLRDNYDCASDPTDVDFTTCDDSGSQETVVNQISKDVQPIDTETDTGDDYLDDGGTGATYLQYEDDIVVVSSASDGSTSVEIDEYDDAYHRHSHVIGGFGWSSTGKSGGGGGGWGGFGGK